MTFNSMDSLSQYYILKGKTPVICTDILERAAWFETAERHLAQETINDYWISTVFLGLDHNFGSSGNPLLFETMVHYRPNKGDDGEWLDEYTRRYSTWDEAETGHQATVKLIRKLSLKVIGK